MPDRNVRPNVWPNVRPKCPTQISDQMSDQIFDQMSDWNVRPKCSTKCLTKCPTKYSTQCPTKCPTKCSTKLSTKYSTKCSFEISDRNCCQRMSCKTFEKCSKNVAFGGGQTSYVWSSGWYLTCLEASKIAFRPTIWFDRNRGGGGDNHGAKSLGRPTGSKEGVSGGGGARSLLGAPGGVTRCHGGSRWSHVGAKKVHRKITLYVSVYRYLYIRTDGEHRRAWFSITVFILFIFTFCFLRVFGLGTI